MDQPIQQQSRFQLGQPPLPIDDALFGHAKDSGGGIESLPLSSGFQHLNNPTQWSS
ncbi:MAG: hypothetical protein LH660_00530 [Phormidesmis sp. CAN_BIN36]|nr:hypothetical protein [Phormidesmis sp. CAN_BIN36]